MAWTLIAAAAIAVLAPVAVAAVPLGKGEGPLSPSLEALAEPSLAVRPPAVQADRLGIPADGPGSLVREEGRVLVTARFARGVVAAFPSLRRAGARIADANDRLQTVTLAIAPEKLRALTTVPGLRAVWQVREPMVRAIEGPCEGGSTISEGLGQLRVDEAREEFELRGKGVTVGVLSDSYDTASGTATDAADDVLSNDLPGPLGTCSEQQLPVGVLEEASQKEGDEGRAMLQIVHDLAPHASLAFATAFESEESFAQNIERLAAPVSAGGADADVIVDDVAWFEEPFFQDGPVAAAINEVTAAGVTYLSATGNDNLFDSEGNEIASWEAPEFRDSGVCPAAILVVPEFNGTHCMDFDPGIGSDPTFGITVEAGETLTVDLQWAEPWNGVGTDLDAFLLSGAGTILTGSVDQNDGPTGTQRPVEILQWENTAASPRTVRLAINRFAGGDPRLKFILLQNGGGVSGVEYPESSGEDVVGPAIYGHAGAASAISVAAVPFVNSDTIEPYSSRGPVVHYFGPVEGAGPAPPLGSPEVVAKPDLTATDCGATTFFAFLSGSTWRFCGTSAAAPHAAAVAALVRQAKSSLSVQQVRDALSETAVPVGSFPAEAAGAGLVDAFEAIGSLPLPIEGGDGPSVVLPTPPDPPDNPVTPPAPAPPPPLPPETRVAPSTSIAKHPRATVRTRGTGARLVFRFRSDQADAGFLCRVNGAALKPCGAVLSRRFKVGRHVVKVKARGATGLVDPTPAVFRFRVIAVP